MSKDIILRRDSDGERTLRGVSRLRTLTAENRLCDWLEDDVASKVADIHVTKNGQYKASSDGLYAFRFVRVDIDHFAPVTSGNYTFQVYLDITGKPHVSVRKTKL